MAKVTSTVTTISITGTIDIKCVVSTIAESGVDNNYRYSGVLTAGKHSVVPIFGYNKNDFGSIDPIPVIDGVEIVSICHSFVLYTVPKLANTDIIIDGTVYHLDGDGWCSVDNFFVVAKNYLITIV